MTEKRFTLTHINEQHLSANLYDDKTFIGSIGVGAELIVELLNTLSDENERLKANYNSLSHNNGLLHDECINKIDALKKENEQLKQRNTNQYNQLNELWQIIIKRR